VVFGVTVVDKLRDNAFLCNISFATHTPTTLHTELGPQLILSHGSPLSIRVSESALPSRSTVPSVSVGPIDGVFHSDVVGGFFFGVVGSFLAAVVPLVAGLAGGVVTFGGVVDVTSVVLEDSNVELED